jgi:hypothetical protein
LSKTKEDWSPLPSIRNAIAMEEEFLVGLSPNTKIELVEGSNGVVMGSN